MGDRGDEATGCQSSIERESGSERAEQEKEEAGECSGSNPVEVIARGRESVLRHVIEESDARFEAALQSQDTLAVSVNRLARVLDKLLEDTPAPFLAQHAARVSGIRKRVVSLSSTLHNIRLRMRNIEAALLRQSARNRSPQAYRTAATPTSASHLPRLHFRPLHLLESHRTPAKEDIPTTNFLPVAASAPPVEHSITAEHDSASPSSPTISLSATDEAAVTENAAACSVPTSAASGLPASWAPPVENSAASTLHEGISFLGTTTPTRSSDWSTEDSADKEQSGRQDLEEAMKVHALATDES